MTTPETHPDRDILNTIRDWPYGRPALVLAVARELVFGCEDYVAVDAGVLAAKDGTHPARSVYLDVTSDDWRNVPNLFGHAKVAGLTPRRVRRHLRAHPHGPSTMRLFPDFAAMTATLLHRRQAQRELAVAEAASRRACWTPRSSPSTWRARTGRCGWSRRRPRTADYDNRRSRSLARPPACARQRAGRRPDGQLAPPDTDEGLR